jgi:hypothetical protein
VDATHGSCDLAPEPDSVAGAAATGGILMMIEPAIGASTSHAQEGAVTLGTPPEVDTTTITSSEVP